jgi:hypothetical protein
MKELVISKKLAASKLNYLLQAHHVIGSVSSCELVCTLDIIQILRAAGFLQLVYDADSSPAYSR